MKQEELLIRANLKQGAFSRVDIGRGIRNSDRSYEGTPKGKKRGLRLLGDEDDTEKENDRNRENRIMEKEFEKGAENRGGEKDRSTKKEKRKDGGGGNSRSNRKLDVKKMKKDGKSGEAYDEETVQKMKEELDKEKKMGSEYRKRYNNEKVLVMNLKSKLKQLEDEKKSLEDQHRKSLINIEHKVATLKNTNLQLLNKAGKYDLNNKQLESANEHKEELAANLKYTLKLTNKTIVRFHHQHAAGYIQAAAKEQEGIAGCAQEDAAEEDHRLL